MIKQILLEFDTSTNQPIPRMPLNQYPMGAVPGIKDQIDDHVKRNWLKYLMAAGMLGRSAHQKYGNFNANATKLQQMQANHAQLSNALKNGQHDDVIKALQPQYGGFGSKADKTELANNLLAQHGTQLQQQQYKTYNAGNKYNSSMFGRVANAMGITSTNTPNLTPDQAAQMKDNMWNGATLPQHYNVDMSHMTTPPPAAEPAPTVETPPPAAPVAPPVQPPVQPPVAPVPPVQPPVTAPLATPPPVATPAPAPVSPIPAPTAKPTQTPLPTLQLPKSGRPMPKTSPAMRVYNRNNGTRPNSTVLNQDFASNISEEVFKTFSMLENDDYVAVDDNDNDHNDVTKSLMHKHGGKILAALAGGALSAGAIHGFANSFQKNADLYKAHNRPNAHLKNQAIANHLKSIDLIARGKQMFPKRSDSSSTK